MVLELKLQSWRTKAWGSGGAAVIQDEVVMEVEMRMTAPAFDREGSFHPEVLSVAYVFGNIRAGMAIFLSVTTSLR